METDAFEIRQFPSDAIMDINDTIVPDGFHDIYHAIKLFIENYMKKATPFVKEIWRRRLVTSSGPTFTIGPLEFKRERGRCTGLVTLGTIIISEKKKHRSPCMALTFTEDVADPEFFLKLKKYMDECMYQLDNPGMH